MKKNNIGYLLREGFRGVFLHGFMSFAAICVTVACLIIMGSFCLILYNTSAMVKELESENEMLVYIDENYSEAKAKSVGSQINLITNVRSATFVSRDQALDDFVETLNDPDAFAGLDPDTLRDRYVVTVEDNSLLKQTYDKLTQIEGVAEVVAHFEIAEGFQTVQNVLNIASLIIVSVLFVVSLFIISNTVKLAMYSRSEEIAIMKWSARRTPLFDCLLLSKALSLESSPPQLDFSLNGVCTILSFQRSHSWTRSSCSS